MNRALSRAARLRHIENLLFRNPHGLRVAEMAAACNVNRRTIYRDISLLSDSGVPLWQDQNRYGIIREQYLATVRLKFHEAVALYIASRLLSRHADEHNPHIISALNKLVATFPDPLATHTSKTAESIQNRPINHTYVKILETIAMGWAENRKIKLWYRSPRSGQVRERTLSPYLLEPSPAGGLYVIGYDDWAKELRTFKLERLEDAQLLQDGYEIPISFDPAEHLANSWGIMTTEDDPVEVQLRFSPAISSLLHERIWHPSQTLVEQEDGSVILSFQISDFREMQPWIRSWGSEVEVLAPSRLRSMIKEDIYKMAALYQQDNNHA